MHSFGASLPALAAALIAVRGGLVETGPAALLWGAFAALDLSGPIRHRWMAGAAGIAALLLAGAVGQGAAEEHARGPGVGDSFWLAGRLVSARVGAVPGQGTVILEPRIAPAGLGPCLMGRLPEAELPPRGSRRWYRAELARGGSCPWARLAVEPAPTATIGGDPEPSAGPADAAGVLRQVWSAGRQPPRYGAVGDRIGVLNGAGLGHLLAPSGLHVGLVFGIAFGVAGLALRLLPWGLLRRGSRGQWAILRWAAGVGAAWTFALGLGAPPSMVRAAGGLTLVALARPVLGRAMAGRQLLVLFALATFVLEPALPRTLSLALSLTAVCFLVPLGMLPTRLRWMGVAVLPWLGTAPLLAGFVESPWGAPLANAVGVPLFAGWVFPLALASAVAQAADAGAFAAVVDDAFRYGVWLLLGWSEWCGQRLSAAGALGLGRDWGGAGLLAWGAAPVVLTGVVQRVSAVWRLERRLRRN